MNNTLRLGVNIDHVATLRNARGGAHPCPVRAALLAKEAGADGITAHLREDRRHIRDGDIRRLKHEVALPLNFEMAATAEMQAMALEINPHAVCLVPEKREERTTEGGLDVAGNAAYLREYIAPLVAAGIRVSMFVAPVAAQIHGSKAIGAQVVELHTGEYAELTLTPALSRMTGEGGTRASGRVREEYLAMQQAAALAASLGLEVHAGHGLNFENVGPIAAIPEVAELNIGHFLVGEAVFTGLAEAIRSMRRFMDEARA